MKHPSNRELFAYWNEKRGPRPAPDRAEIEPGGDPSACSATPMFWKST